MAERSRLDALDLIIRVLIEHEKTLNSLLERMDGMTDRLEEMVERLEVLYEPQES
ncbi:MAG: hypothetical protein WC941_09165 [Candidatus Bathyarchaeia archaeon]